MIARRKLWLTDAREVCRDVRPEDRTEWLVAAEELDLGPDLVRLVSGCILSSTVGGAITEDGRPLCIWGASEAEPGVGLAWLIGTVRGQQVAHRIQRHFAAAIMEMHEQYPVLEAHAYKENRLHHYWMERLGFGRVGTSHLLPSGRFILFRRDLTALCA